MGARGGRAGDGEGAKGVSGGDLGALSGLWAMCWGRLGVENGASGICRASSVPRFPRLRSQHDSRQVLQEIGAQKCPEHHQSSSQKELKQPSYQPNRCWGGATGQAGAEPGGSRMFSILLKLLHPPNASL